jgi:hypothetical protein
LTSLGGADVKELCQVLSRFERDAFAWYEDGSGRLDGESFGVVTLIDGDADAASGVLIEEGIADGDVHEGFAEGEDERFAVELEADFVADGVTKGAKIVALNVGNERAKRIVEADDVAGDSFFFDGSGFGRESNELRNVRAGDGEIPTSGEMSGSRRKNVAAVEGGRPLLIDFGGIALKLGMPPFEFAAQRKVE